MRTEYLNIIFLFYFHWLLSDIPSIAVYKGKLLKHWPVNYISIRDPIRECPGAIEIFYYFIEKWIKSASKYIKNQRHWQSSMIWYQIFSKFKRFSLPFISVRNETLREQTLDFILFFSELEISNIWTMLRDDLNMEILRQSLVCLSTIQSKPPVW